MRFVYKRGISITKLASGVQNWRFVYKYTVFNLQTSISTYKMASRITTQRDNCKQAVTANKDWIDPDLNKD